MYFKDERRPNNNRPTLVLTFKTLFYTVILALWPVQTVYHK